MIEYLYDVIRATSGQDIVVNAVITTDDGDNYEEGCGLRLYDDEKMLFRVAGTFDGEQWSFRIPAENTEGLVGRYWYCICHNNNNLCFKTPFYLK